jgi:hypothetical protein
LPKTLSIVRIGADRRPVPVVIEERAFPRAGRCLKKGLQTYLQKYTIDAKSEPSAKH